MSLYVIKYKEGKNVVVDALSRKYTFFPTLNAKLLWFKLLKVLYVKDLILVKYMLVVVRLSMVSTSYKMIFF